MWACHKLRRLSRSIEYLATTCTHANTLSLSLSLFFSLLCSTIMFKKKKKERKTLLRLKYYQVLWHNFLKQYAYTCMCVCVWVCVSMLCKCLFARFLFVFVCCFFCLCLLLRVAHAKYVAYFSAHLDMPAICGRKASNDSCQWPRNSVSVYVCECVYVCESVYTIYRIFLYLSYIFFLSINWCFFLSFSFTFCFNK